MKKINTLLSLSLLLLFSGSLWSQQRFEKTKGLYLGQLPNASLNEIIQDKKSQTGQSTLDNIPVIHKFITKSGSFIINLSDLGIEKTTDVVVDFTNASVIKGPPQETSSTTPLARRFTVSAKEGYTDVVIQKAIYDEEKKPIGRGKILKVYRVTVSSANLVAVTEELQALIGDVEGLELRIVGTQVVIDGKVLIPKDMVRVSEVIRKFVTDKKPILNLVEVSPMSYELLARKMEEEIAGGPEFAKNIKVKVVNGRFFLEGLVDKTYDKEVAEKICQSFIQPVYKLNTILKDPAFSNLNECNSLISVRRSPPLEPDPIINVRVDFVTMSRNYLKNFEFSWAPGVSFPESGNTASLGSSGGLVSNFTAIFRNLFPKLNTAASHNHARILKSVSLLVRDGTDAANGQSAKSGIFTENLQIPIVIPGTAAAPGRVELRDVQTSVNVTPKSIPGTDKIVMDLIVQQSELQPAIGGAGDAPILQNSINTSLVIDNGESAALGGIIRENRRISVNRNPASDQEGFKFFNIGNSKSMSDEKVQFVVFVTPQKLRTPTEGTESLKRKFKLRK